LLLGRGRSFRVIIAAAKRFSLFVSSLVGMPSLTVLGIMVAVVAMSIVVVVIVVEDPVSLVGVLPLPALPVLG
jgi:hypothetical protein